MEIKHSNLWKAYAGLPMRQKRVIKPIVFKNMPPAQVALQLKFL